MTDAHRGIRDPSSPPSRIGTATIELVVGATLLVATMSFIAASLGDPELMALVACAGIAITLPGLAILSANHRVGDDGSSDLAA